MANGKGGGAQASKKKGGRRGKSRSADSRKNMLSNTGELADTAPMQVTVAKNISTETKPSGASMTTTASSSGKQGQMVFTVGTFDEYDNESDNNSFSERRSSILRSRIQSPRLQKPDITDVSGTEAAECVASIDSNAEAGKGDGMSSAAETNTTPAALLTTGLSDTAGSSRHTNNIRQTDYKGRDDGVTSIKPSRKSDNLHQEEVVGGLSQNKREQKQQPIRQPLFTMGSHSEMSDMDYADAYDTKGRVSPSREFSDKSPVRTKDLHPQSSGNSQLEILPPNAKISMETTGLITNSRRASNGEARKTGGEHKDVANESQGNNHSPAVLHACKAMTSLHLAHPSDSHSYIENSVDVIYSNDMPPGLAVRERVTSAPSIQSAVEDSGREQESAFATQRNQTRAVSEGLQSSRGKIALQRDSHVKSRKRPTNRKAHVKKAASSAALRTRLRHGTGQRRDYPAKTSIYGGGTASSALAVDEGSHIEGSYVDYSDDSDSREYIAPPMDEERMGQQQQQQPYQARAPGVNTRYSGHVNANVLGQTRHSPNSSTATLGEPCQDADDSATTASMDSSRQEQGDSIERQATASVVPVVAAQSSDGYLQNSAANADDMYRTTHGQDDQGEHLAASNMRRSARQRELHSHSPEQLSQQLVANDSSRPEETPRIVSSSSSSSSTQSYIAGFDTTDQASAARMSDSRQLNGGRDTQKSNVYRNVGERRMSEEHAALSGAYGTSGHMSINTNRNMESLRQQSIIEREEEELEIASSQLTGMPRRNNRPLSMVPHIFLNPNTPAYAQQVRKTERVYAHARSMEHPLLESISRCVSLREQRIAMGVPRSQPRPWVSRRTMAEPGEADLQAEWWESLMPPPPSQHASARDQRVGIGSSGRAQPPDLPYWISAPDATKCAVYGPDMVTPGSGTAHTHEPIDPSCDHVCYLRERAKQLRLIRQQALSTGRNQTQQSTRSPTMQTTTSMAALDTWHGRRVPGMLGVDMYPGNTRPVDVNEQNNQRQTIEQLASSSPDSIKLGRANQLARPYRRFGTVYGCTTLNPAGANVDTTGGPYTVVGGSGTGFAANIAGGGVIPMRGQDGILSARTSGVNGWENDPRRSSYFDRLSIDDQRPQISSSSNVQTTTGGFLRRVISGLAGGTAAAFGASQ